MLNILYDPIQLAVLLISIGFIFFIISLIFNLSTRFIISLNVLLLLFAIVVSLNKIMAHQTLLNNFTFYCLNFFINYILFCFINNNIFTFSDKHNKTGKRIIFSFPISSSLNEYPTLFLKLCICIPPY
jgi:hypothetical protein